jgi:hypothetical protein
VTEPTQGKFASAEDVTGAFEGTFPTNRLPWVNRRIGMVERELMYQVPSLRKSVDEINAESIAAGDPDRVERVKDIVCEKVLDLYRNPGGARTQHSTTTPDITVSNAWRPDSSQGLVQFTSSQLDSVRLHTRRQKFGTIMVLPGNLTC